MCLLTFYPPTVMPDLTALRNGTICNPDGHGYAIITDGRLVVDHGMDAAAMIDAFEGTRHRYPDGPALFHSRYATHGHTTLDNCHPFTVGGDTRTVLAHNGVLPTTVRPGKGDRRSDTRITAEEFLPALGSLHTRRNRRLFERWMTPHNKMVLLTVDRRFTRRAYLFNEASGIWDGGVWYSNDGYLPDITTGLTDDTLWDWPLVEPGPDQRYRCPYCREGLDMTEDTCRTCGWCLDCGDMPDDCSCWAPTIRDARFRPLALTHRDGTGAAH